MITFEPLHPLFNPEMLGFLPSFFSESDPRPAREQLDTNYQHGGGWRPMDNWQLVSHLTFTIKYPGDPALKPIAKAKLRDETILLYRHSIVAIVQPDHSFEIGRVD